MGTIISHSEEHKVVDKKDTKISPIIPSRNSVGYTNLLEKMKKIREEIIAEEYVIVDEM